IAIVDAVHLLSPSLTWQFHGAALPVFQYTRPSAGSKTPVVHVGPPPCRHVSPGHVSCPGSPGPGTVYAVQRAAPVRASNAFTNPRMPNSPPATPVRTMSFTTSGAPVML